MRCWAYYTERKDEVPEDYLKHTLDVVEYMVNSPLLNGIARKAHYMTNIDEGFIKDLILISGLFHDIGKTWIKYQVENKALDFNGHELISALITLRALKRAGLVEDCKVYCDTWLSNILKNDTVIAKGNALLGPISISFTFMPIIFHHYAFGEEKRVINAIVDLDKAHWEVSITEDCRGAIEESINKSRNYISTKSAETIINIVKDYVLDKTVKIAEISTEDLRSIINNVRLNTLTSTSAAALSLLNEADGKVAMKNRRGIS